MPSRLIFFTLRALASSIAFANDSIVSWELPQKLQAVLLQYLQESMRRRGRSRAGGGARMDSIRNSESKKSSRVFGFGSPTIVTQPLFPFQVLL